jgi:hypothetical protein
MTKARTIADLGTGFVNISDTGTEGTKVAYRYNSSTWLYSRSIKI